MIELLIIGIIKWWLMYGALLALVLTYRVAKADDAIMASLRDTVQPIQAKSAIAGFIVIATATVYLIVVMPYWALRRRWR